MTSEKNKSTMDNKALSDAQQKLQRLSQKITDKSELLKQWQAVLAQYQQYIQQNETLTITSAYKIELLKLFDQFYDSKDSNHSSRHKMSHLISSISKDLIINQRMLELVPLYNKYNKIPFSIETENQGEDSPSSTQVTQQDSKPKQKIYRKLLASIYTNSTGHDEQDINQQTDLLHQTTAIAENANILELLALHLKLNQIKPDDLTYFSHQELKQINRLLEEQLSEICQEIKQIKTDISRQLGTHFFCHLQPEKILENFNSDLSKILDFQRIELQASIDFFNDPNHLKNWLKKYQISKNMPSVIFAGYFTKIG